MQTKMLLKKPETTISRAKNTVSNNQNSKSAAIKKNVRTTDYKKLLQIMINDPDSITRDEFMIIQSAIGYRQTVAIREEAKLRKRQSKLDQSNVAMNLTSLNKSDSEIKKNSDGKKETKEIMRNDVKKPLQMKKNDGDATDSSLGIPKNLRAGLEKLSGIDLSDVKVHRNSDKPQRVGALAYTQGNDIHIATGQEKYLPHEGWHVVQQKQGRVKPTLQLKSGDKINDEGRLEKEADVMGSKAAKESSSMNGTVQFKESFNVKQENKVIQRNSKKENNQTDDILDGIQTVIDVIGFVPGVGDIADGVNAGISIVRKDWLGAVLSGIALIPVVGSAMAVPMKTISKVGSKIGDISKTVKNAIMQLVKLLGGAKNVTSKLNRYLDNLKGLLRKLPNLMEKVANSRAVKWLTGKKIVKSILAFAKKIQSGVETVCKKADEVFSNVKKAIAKGTNNAIKGGLDVFGNLSKAAEYGLDSYSALQKKLKGTELEAHHIIEKRLAKALGISSTNSMLSVAVNKTEHQVFTNAWRVIIPYGTDYSKLSKDQIWQAAQKVYKNYPALLEAAKKTIFK